MNRRRLRQWFAWPDAARSPWKRRLLWGMLFVLVLAGLIAWRASRPMLAEDVNVAGVSREEATRIVEGVNRFKRAQVSYGGALFASKTGRWRYWFGLVRSEKILEVTGFIDEHEVTPPSAIVRTHAHQYWLGRTTNGWEMMTVTELTK